MAEAKKSGGAARLVFTLLAPLVVFAARRLPLPGAGVDSAHVPEIGREFLAGKLSPVALGLAPFVAATLLVELVAAAIPRLRPLRTSGPRGRAKLARVSAIVFIFVAALQGLALTQTLRTVVDGVDVPRVVMTVVAGSAALLILATFVGRRGLTHGVLIVLASDAIAGTFDDALAHPRGLGLPPIPILLGGAVAAMLVTLLTLRKVDRDQKALLRAPIAGVWPVRLAAGALGAAATMSSRLGAPVHHWLADVTGYVAAWIALTVVFTLALVPLVADASFLAPLAARSKEASFADAEAEAKKAVSDALSPSLTFLLLLVLVGEVVAAIGGYALNLFGLALAAALVLDALAEVHARKKIGELVAVWSEVRPYAIGPAARALGAADIDFHVRDERQRLLLGVLGPFAPSDILVAPDDARRATEILADVLPTRAPSKDDAPEDKAAIETETKAASGSAVGAAIAIVVTHFVYRITPTLPTPVLAGLSVDPSERVELAILPVDDDVDVFAGASELPRGVRIHAENVPIGSDATELRHYAVVVAMNEGGDDVDRTLADAQPFFAKLKLPPGDHLVFGALRDDDADHGDAKTSALRTWVVRGGPPVVTAADVARVAPIPAKLSGAGALGIELTPDAAVRLRALTARSLKRRIAIVVDGRIESAPIVMAEIADGYLQISPGVGDPAAQDREVSRLARGLTPH